MTHRFLFLLGTAAFSGLAVLPAAPLAAQGRAVVQPLPPAASAELNRALRRLNSNARDVDALILAGESSLELGDIDAAIGFFGRAEELSPANPRVKAGTAAAYVRVQRPVEALRLFEEAELQGVRPISVAGDKGLAHDLVGNNRRAQLAYRQALSYEEDAEIRRRMALSYAMSGDREEFESTLLPLLEQRDFAAYRTRSFGLAILGEPDEAVAIADAVMPQQMAERVEPYLRYMRRLTPAQQAAAANLGIFPRAAAIGRDDPRIVAAREAGSAPALAGVDTGLAPAGTPLGPTASAPSTPVASATGSAANSSGDGGLTREQRRAILAQRRQRGRLPSRADRQVRLAQTAAASRAATQSDAAATPAATATVAAGQAVASAPAPAAARTTERGELPAVAQAELPPAQVSITLPATQSAPEPEPQPVQIAQAATPSPLPAATPTPEVIEPVPQPLAQVAVAPSQAAIVEPPSATSAAVTVATLETATPAPGFDLSVLPSQTQPTIVLPDTALQSSAAPVQIAEATPQASPAATPPASPAAPAPQEPEPTVSSAFGDLMALPASATAAPASDAVDITAIEIPREEEAAPEATAAVPEATPEPEMPVNASRIWVQIATGRDRSALRFDWRRFARQAPDILGDNGPYVATWGQTNRLLAGPYDSRSAANSAVTALAEKGIGAFRFTSAAGQEIEDLN